MLENTELIPLALLAAGALATMIGLLKLIQHGMALMIWIVMMLAGIWGVSYGWTHMGEELQPAIPDEIRKQLEAIDVTGKLADWCDKL
ncbi:MAG: hypothetical protein HQM13_08655 [SAR324 cluster bacterium]|nr:hypothetical protein [SAR324 cluster bacterium]